MDHCCDQYGCQRSQAVLLRYGPNNQAWLAVTRHRRTAENTVVPLEQHRLPDDEQRALARAFACESLTRRIAAGELTSVPEIVTRAREMLGAEPDHGAPST